MRLLHTTNLNLEEFFDENVPEYAILSHRWENGEVSFQDFVAIQQLEDPRYRPYADFLSLSMKTDKSSLGYKKILRCCEIAKSDGWDWAWVDTCCIDKTSSAELSEAINSMYKWYQNSKICYAYLSDVNGEAGNDDTHQLREGQFLDSKWFARGWTLQELLAPKNVLFLDCRWQRIGTRYELKKQVRTATGIPEDVINDGLEAIIYDVHKYLGYNKYSTAQKMSWASKRECSREEDKSYCLIGLFGINMTLLYGEGGERAFTRLQNEILKKSPDESVFAWGKPGLASEDFRSNFALLAKSPQEFMDSVVHRAIISRRPYLVVNRQLQMDAHVLDIPPHHLQSVIKMSGSRTEWFHKFALIPLDCTSTGTCSSFGLNNSPLALVVCKLKQFHYGNEHQRYYVLRCIELKDLGFIEGVKYQWRFLAERKTSVYLRLFGDSVPGP